jgi:hypothetical protein
MLRTTPLRISLVAAALVATATHARGAEFDGWGDTGWVYASKRDCCNGAIAIAQQYSATACLDSGGEPRPPMGGGRGSCSSEWSQNADGSILYRCYAEASVWCR